MEIKLKNYNIGVSEYIKLAKIATDTQFLCVEDGEAILFSDLILYTDPLGLNVLPPSAFNCGINEYFTYRETKMMGTFKTINETFSVMGIYKDLYASFNNHGVMPNMPVHVQKKQMCDIEMVDIFAIKMFSDILSDKKVEYNKMFSDSRNTVYDSEEEKRVDTMVYSITAQESYKRANFLLKLR